MLNLTVSRVCYIVAAGPRTKSYTVGACNDYTLTDASTGWQSSFHTFVEEMRADLMKDCGVSRPINCDD